MRYLLTLIFCVFLLAGCIQSENDGFVELDGPILESVNKEGQLEFNGVIVNNGDVAVQSVFVVIILKDESGNVVEANSTPLFDDGNLQALYPYQREFFTISLNSQPDRVFTKEVEIYYDEFNEDEVLDVDKSDEELLDTEFVN
ncbi:MAG TPA: FxLYD domain-containing protein [Thermodesulfobacteriota bacterium]|nr:FxLYD domain-containing protein [Thermodesulfobacteriota bacterium]